MNIWAERDYLTVAIIAACIASYWYGCWAYGAAKGYPILAIFLPWMSFFGLAVLLFLQDQDSMPESTEVARPWPGPTES